MNYEWLSQAPRSALLIGDSLAVGLGSPLATELGALGTTLTTRAEVSTNADQWRRRAPAIFESLRPDIVLMSLGSNDAQSSSLTAAFPDNLRAICDAARAAGAKRCALLVAPNRTASEVAHDGVEAIWPLPVQLSSDGIHPTATGYHNWASDLAPLLVVAPRTVTPPTTAAVAAKAESSFVPWLVVAAAVAAGFWVLFRGRVLEA